MTEIKGMKQSYLSSMPLTDFGLWKELERKRAVTGFGFEVTERCNLNCRHCYINRPESDPDARKAELGLEEIKGIVDQAVSMGALWCLLTGGEPLLRRDFFEVYDYLKKKGLLVSIYTNATLVTEKHVRLFNDYPPRDIEITVYGATEKTYETVTRVKGSYRAFRRGLDRLIQNGIKIRLKAMALRSNVHELGQIADFCKKHTKDYFRFDPFLTLRYDGDPFRNREISLERLAPAEIAALEREDPERFQALLEQCDRLIVPEFSDATSHLIFRCGAGMNSFSLSADGRFKLCSSLCHPACVYDLRKGSLSEAWHTFIPKIRGIGSGRQEYREKCGTCSLLDLCMWCPANAHLETESLDAPVDYFCHVARARAEAIKGLDIL